MYEAEYGDDLLPPDGADDYQPLFDVEGVDYVDDVLSDVHDRFPHLDDDVPESLVGRWDVSPDFEDSNEMGRSVVDGTSSFRPPGFSRCSENAWASLMCPVIRFVRPPR